MLSQNLSSCWLSCVGAVCNLSRVKASASRCVPSLCDASAGYLWDEGCAQLQLGGTLELRSQSSTGAAKPCTPSALVWAAGDGHLSVLRISMILWLQPQAETPELSQLFLPCTCLGTHHYERPAVLKLAACLQVAVVKCVCGACVQVFP